MLRLALKLTIQNECSKPLEPQRLFGFEEFYIEFLYNDRHERMVHLYHPFLLNKSLYKTNRESEEQKIWTM